MESKKNIFIQGETIILRPLELKDIEGNYRFWLNDAEIVHHNSHGRFPMTEEKLSGYIKSTQNTRSMIVLAIEDISTGIHIGNISLQGINWVDRNAEIAFLLGERNFWGKGIMFQAGKLLINHAFDVLNLHRVYCGTSSDNIGMQKLAVKLGMLKEGVRTDALFNHGNYYDIVEYGAISKY